MCIVKVSCHKFAPLSFTVILGNHEYYTGDVDSWIEELPRHGVTPLVNQRVCLFGEEKQGCSGGLYLAGLEDIETRRIK